MNNQTLLYLYFDSIERTLKDRETIISNWLLRGSTPITYNDLTELMRIRSQLDIIGKIELDLNSLLFYND